ANSLQMLVALAFSALGGFLVPLQNLPDAARTVASYTPNGVAVRTMRDLASGETRPVGGTGARRAGCVHPANLAGRGARAGAVDLDICRRGARDRVHQRPPGGGDIVVTIA